MLDYPRSPPELPSPRGDPRLCSKHGNLLCPLQPSTVVCIIASVALPHVEYKRPWPLFSLSQDPPLRVRYAWLKQFHIAFSKAASLLRCSPCVCSLKFHQNVGFFFYFDIVCILYVELESASMKSTVLLQRAGKYGSVIARCESSETARRDVLL